MDKVPLWLSLTALAVISVGTHFAANTPMFWLASAAAPYQYLRVAVGLIIVLQLMTSPPRHVTFRIIAGVFAAMVFGLAIQQTYTYQMALSDTAVFIGASATIFATALERNVVVEENELVKNEPKHHWQQKIKTLLHA